MTATQKIVLQKLLDGHHIGFAGAGLIRLRDAEARPIQTLRQATFDWLKKWDLVRRKKGVYLVNRKTIRSLHGNSSIKRLYKGKPVAGIVLKSPPP